MTDSILVEMTPVMLLSVRERGLRESGDGSPAAYEDQTAIPLPAWDDFTDGRLRRLKRGKHYSRNSAILLHEAKLAASERGKQAVSYQDRLGKIEYIWLQFLDGSLAPDAPCPRCGGTRFDAVQKYFLRCTACRSLYSMRERAPTTTAAEFLSTRLLSPDGAEMGEMRVSDEATVEAVCEFHRPVAVAHLSCAFYAAKRRKVLNSGCPDLIVVPSADTVRFQLNLDPRVLSAGEYSIVPKLELVLDEQDRRLHSVRPPGRLRVHVLDPAHPTADGAMERSPLEWSAVSALDGRPMPIYDDGEADGEAPEGEEPEEEDGPEVR